MNFAVASVNAVGSPPSANVSLFPMSHTTTLTSYVLGSASKEILPSVSRRNCSLETRSANNVRIKCEWFLCKKNDHPSAARNANNSDSTAGAGLKNTREREQTHARPNSSTSNNPINNHARHRGTLLKVSQTTPRTISNTKTYCHFF